MAIDAGDPDFAPPPQFDQRGAPFARVVNGRVDIGAYEFGALPADLTGDGFVDFEDLTELLAAWNQNVSAAEGNLVDAAGTPVNFEDLTVLLAAWTGPGPAGAPVGRRLAAARKVSPDEGANLEGDVKPEAPRQAAAYERASRRRDGTANPLRRLQAAAVDRAIAHYEGDVLQRRLGRFARRR